MRAGATRRVLAAVFACIALTMCFAGQAGAADEPEVFVPGAQDSFSPQAAPASSPRQRIQGYPLTAGDAFEAAEKLPEVQGERARHPDITAKILVAAYLPRPNRWLVIYSRRGEDVMQVEVDAQTGAIAAFWTGYKINWFMARGDEGQFGRKANSPVVWLPLCILFLLPFFDPRRPLRMLHLDLLVLISFSVSLFYFNEGEIGVSVPLAYPPLIYLLARALWLGFGRRQGSGPLVPFASARLLVVGAVLVTAFKIGLDVWDGKVIDVGFAGVRGADRIRQGLELYVFNEFYSDVYGPVNYLVYVPFLEIFGWSGKWDALPAAHAASVTFDLFTLFGMFFLGRSLRAGREGLMLGAALAYAWAAYPFSTYALMSNSNDSLVAGFVAWSLVAVRSTWGRGVLTGLGGMVKFAPFALVPLLAAGTGERRLRSLAIFAIALAAAVALTLLPFLPAGGLREFYDTTIGFQAGRESPFSIWGQEASLGWMQTAVKVAGLALGVLVFFLPRRREPVQVAALAAAVLIAIQLPADHWFYLYLVWFMPPLLGALFAVHARQDSDAGGVREPPRPVAAPA